MTSEAVSVPLTGGASLVGGRGLLALGTEAAAGSRAAPYGLDRSHLERPLVVSSGRTLARLLIALSVSGGTWLHVIPQVR